MKKSILFCLTLIAIFFTVKLTSETISDNSYQSIPLSDTFWNEVSHHGNIPVESRDNDIFYWYFQSRTTPKKDPLIIWFQGGPGYSSIQAAIDGIGPFLLNKSTKELDINPYSWNTKANLVFVDQPAGVGLSNGLKKDQSKTKKQVQRNVYQFIIGFLEKHPDLKQREIYLAGQSYAGKYLPWVAEYILKQKKFDRKSDINLKGIMIGNGLLDPYIQKASGLSYAIHHKLVTKKTEMESQEEVDKCQKYLTDFKLKKVRIARNVQKEIENYGPCVMIINRILFDDQDNQMFDNYDITEACQDSENCHDYKHIEDFMNRDDVKVFMKSDKGFKLVNSDVNQAMFWTQKLNVQNEMKNILDSGVRVIGFYGELDLQCNWEGGLAVFNKLEWNGKGDFNRANVVDVGYGLMKTARNLTFVKVRGAGHNVAEKQPKGCLDMIIDFIFGG